ncbi:MAG: hypothetical protein WA431_01220 [Candidatus Cybelea sp.]
MFRTLQPKTAFLLTILVGLSWVTLARATTIVPSQTFKAGTRIATAVDETLNSTSMKYGAQFKLRIVDTAHPSLNGAEIIGYIGDVTQPSGANRARVTFFLTSIKLRNGTTKPISAFVLSRRVTPYDPGAVAQMRRQMIAAPPMPNGTVTPGPVAWQMTFNGGGSPTISTRPSGLLGGTVTAAGANEPIVVPAGTPVTVELQQPLTIP